MPRHLNGSIIGNTETFKDLDKKVMYMKDQSSPKNDSNKQDRIDNCYKVKLKQREKRCSSFKPRFSIFKNDKFAFVGYSSEEES